MNQVALANLALRVVTNYLCWLLDGVSVFVTLLAAFSMFAIAAGLIERGFGVGA